MPRGASVPEIAPHGLLKRLCMRVAAQVLHSDVTPVLPAQVLHSDVTHACPSGEDTFMARSTDQPPFIFLGS
jgi:hypothetical protein